MGIWKVSTGVAGGILSAVIGRNSNTTPNSTEPEELSKQQIIIAMSEIERTREVTAYLMGYSEEEILKGLTNSKSIIKKELATANSRVVGEKIKNINELKNRIKMYNEYISKSGQAKVDVYVTPRRLRPKITPLTPKSIRP
ncbi:MAG: hypothetical protein Q4D53_03195 [Leptotrichiaceae bacterium]|nr:hypothetical protein [Leptotrichiaceae bacterium]